MGVTRSLPTQDAVVRIGRWVLRHRRTKAGANLHAFKDEVNPVAIEPLRPPQPRTHIVLRNPFSTQSGGWGSGRRPTQWLFSIVRCRKTSLVMALEAIDDIYRILAAGIGDDSVIHRKANVTAVRATVRSTNRAVGALPYPHRCDTACARSGWIKK